MSDQPNGKMSFHIEYNPDTPDGVKRLFESGFEIIYGPDEHPDGVLFEGQCTLEEIGTHNGKPAMVLRDVDTGKLITLTDIEIAEDEDE